MTLPLQASAIPALETASALAPLPRRPVDLQAQLGIRKEDTAQYLRLKDALETCVNEAVAQGPALPHEFWVELYQKLHLRFPLIFSGPALSGRVHGTIIYARQHLRQLLEAPRVVLRRRVAVERRPQTRAHTFATAQIVTRSRSKLRKVPKYD
ncbi:hypothetical protein B0H15DRAFT_829722 [Mycena belliarum]|uniref:Uncharacterized protein n=1 Tax=Mycena belliarum TaxID=1033014 RepID=A0AAD6XTF2_9AGAR|nr:hypothetical protein B0H15DRAFT_829722 [Mycena belliae]